MTLKKKKYQAEENIKTAIANIYFSKKSNENYNK